MVDQAVQQFENLGPVEDIFVGRQRGIRIDIKRRPKLNGCVSGDRFGRFQ